MSRAPERIIVIVHRDQRELYARMRERYGEVALVILDRRHTQRRQRAGVERDRRRRDRRQPWSVQDMDRWRRLGYRLLYRSQGIEVDPASDTPGG